MRANISYWHKRSSLIREYLKESGLKAGTDPALGTYYLLHVIRRQCNVFAHFLRERFGYCAVSQSGVELARYPRTDDERSLFLAAGVEYAI